ncbi:MAG TPA: DUF885 domain-containing protein [Thermoanaerobaculia bacterium]|nr:DUF885 domain-containing protein [Thermoanaerobaculia bacterium]
MHRFRRLALPLAIFAFAALPAAAQSWVERSNANAQLLLDAQARFAPELAGAFGVEGLDEQVLSLPLDRDEQVLAALAAAGAELERRRAAERDPAVLQDLDILLAEVAELREDTTLERKHFLPVMDLPQTLFQGIRVLLDDRVAKERHAAALVRLRKYAGLAPGTAPLTEQAAALLRDRLDEPALLRPFQGDLERQLGNSARFLDGIAELFRAEALAGWEEPLARLREQVAAYEALLRAEVLPQARQDFRLPEEVYSFRLRQRGVDMPVAELVSRAKTSFREVQNEMQSIAALLARERKLPSPDYRDVLRALKKDQLVGEAILPHYQQRVRDLEKLIREARVVTLPERQMRVRLATAAESAATPAPNVSPARIIGNTGETPDFVLPLRIPGEAGSDAGFDDFTFTAASWTLTAHEGRPGHELQFSTMVEKGVSLARGFFAFNSVNVEGWALYAEAEMKPLLPLDGQLVALQHRLLRAARAYLDPGLHAGTITREEAFRVLEGQVVLSHAMALQEVERYTFRSPGQAPSYFVGYTRLMELRTDAERLLGDRFDRQAYHDFVLSQGMISPALLRKAVVEQHVAERLGPQTARTGG